MLFSSNAWTLSLEIVGLSLAVLDFFGLTARLEALMLRWRDWERDFVPYMRKSRTAIFPLHKHWRTVLRYALTDIAIIAMFAAGAWTLGDRDRIVMATNSVPLWVWWSALFWAPCALVFLHVATRQIMGPAGAALSFALWRALWLLSRPKAGIVGSLGMLIAGVTFALSRFPSGS